MTTALVAYALAVHVLVAVGAVVRRAGRDPLRPDRDRARLQQAMDDTDRTGAHAPR